MGQRFYRAKLGRNEQHENTIRPVVRSGCAAVAGAPGDPVPRPSRAGVTPDSASPGGVNARTTAAQRELLARLAQEAAIYMQGKWLALDGQDRLNKATEHLFEEAMKHGIPLTAESGMAALKVGYETARVAGMLEGKALRRQQSDYSITGISQPGNGNNADGAKS